jgi:hypothetical protein
MTSWSLIKDQISIKLSFACEEAVVAIVTLVWL